MIVRYLCPHPTCRWFFSHTVTPRTANVPTDILTWTPANWDAMAERTGPGLTAAHIIDGHLVTHSPVEWMTELRRYQARAEAAEDRADRLEDALEQTADVTAGMHPVTSMRLPSRAEVEMSAAALAAAVNGGAANAEA